MHTKLFYERSITIPFSTKINWLRGIAAGMYHLVSYPNPTLENLLIFQHQEKVIHRDLAR